MGCEVPCWDLSRAITDPQQKCGLGPQYPHGIRQPTVPCQIRRSFRTVLQDKWDATWLTSTGFIKSPSRNSHEEDIKPPAKRRKSTEQQPIPNGEINDHLGKGQMVVVATKEPLRHQTVLASKQRPAKSSLTPPAYLCC